MDLDSACQELLNSINDPIMGYASMLKADIRPEDPLYRAETAPCEQGGERMSLRRGSETILVVDDEALVRDLARDIMRRFGYTVLTADGGPQAVELYRQRSGDIAVVILDIMMPHMNGREAFQRLREVNPGVKVIISSGYSHDRDADDLLALGAAGFVQKPYRMADLVKMVGDVIEGKA